MVINITINKTFSIHDSAKQLFMTVIQQKYINTFDGLTFTQMHAG